jgi:hypothetical protein
MLNDDIIFKVQHPEQTNTNELYEFRMNTKFKFASVNTGEDLININITNEEAVKGCI